MAKYIKCDCCGKKIELGADVYKYPSYTGLYCSAECFADSYGELHELDCYIIEICVPTVYDDEIRKAEIQQELEAHRKAFTKLLAEYEQLIKETNNDIQ